MEAGSWRLRDCTDYPKVESVLKKIAYVLTKLYRLYFLHIFKLHKYSTFIIQRYVCTGRELES